MCHCTLHLLLLCCPYKCACLQPSHLPGYPLDLVLSCLCTPGLHLPAEELTGAAACTGAAPTPSPVWDSSGHGQEQLLGTVQRHPWGLWDMGKEQVNCLLCWSQCWHCQHREMWDFIPMQLRKPQYETGQVVDCNPPCFPPVVNLGCKSLPCCDVTCDW